MNQEKHTSSKVIDDILVITLNSPNSKVNMKTLKIFNVIYVTL